MSYTKGKWVVDDREDLAGKFYSDDATGSIIGDCQHYYLAPRSLDERKANAKRIVDCVNACEGMENPADEIEKLRYEIAMLYSLIDDKDSEIARIAIIAAKAENNLADALNEIDELWASSAWWQ